MERAPESAPLAQQLWKRGCGNDRRDFRRHFLFRLLPMALGPLGHVHAHPNGRLEYRAGLPGDFSSIKLSLVTSAVERPDPDEPNVDDVRRIAADRRCDRRTSSGNSTPNRVEHADRHLFLRRSYLLHLGQRRRLARHGKHAPLRVLRPRADRARFFAFFASISPPTAAVACLWDGCRGVGQRPRAKRAGLVCLEFYPRELGGLTKNEINCRNYRSRTGGIDGRVSAFEKQSRRNRARSGSGLRWRNFAHQHLQRFSFRYRRPSLFL